MKRVGVLSLLFACSPRPVDGDGSGSGGGTGASHGTSADAMADGTSLDDACPSLEDEPGAASTVEVTIRNERDAGRYIAPVSLCERRFVSLRSSELPPGWSTESSQVSCSAVASDVCEQPGECDGPWLLYVGAGAELTTTLPLRLFDTVEPSPECHGSPCATRCERSRAIIPGTYQLAISVGTGCRIYESDPAQSCDLCNQTCDLEDSVTDPTDEIVVEVELPSAGPLEIVIAP